MHFHRVQSQYVTSKPVNCFISFWEGHLWFCCIEDGLLAYRAGFVKKQDVTIIPFYELDLKVLYCSSFTTLKKMISNENHVKEQLRFQENEMISFRLYFIKINTSKLFSFVSNFFSPLTNVIES